MKKKYEAPKVERMEFDYSKIMTASSGSTRCFIGGMGVYWNNVEGQCENHAPGDQ